MEFLFFFCTTLNKVRLIKQGHVYFSLNYAPLEYFYKCFGSNEH